MYRFRVGIGSDDDSGACVEDGAERFGVDGFTVNSDGVHLRLPKPIVGDVVECDKGFGIEFGSVKPAKGDLSIVLLVGKTGDLVGDYRVFDETLRSERFDRGENALVGEGLRICFRLATTQVSK